MPERIQMKRTKGWRKPENCVYVGRPTKWGNAFKVGVNVCTGSGLSYNETPIKTRQDAVTAFKEMLAIPGRNYPTDEEIVRELRGKDLACWCPLDQPCHADVLLELANRPTGA